MRDAKQRLRFVLLNSLIGIAIIAVALGLAFISLPKEFSGEILVEPKTISEVTLLEIYKDDGEMKKPLIILQHGFKNKKEAMISLGEELAEKGFFVVAPDAYAHGQRNEDPLSLVEIIVETSEEYDEIILNYESDNRVDVDRLGMSGFSMGGCICFHYAVNGQYKPDVMAPTITTPYFEQLIGTDLGKSIYNSSEGVKVEVDPNNIERINQYIRDNSPFSNYVNLLGVHMLMQNGSEDTYVTSEGVEKLKTALESHENEGYTVEFVSVPGMKHKVNAQMKQSIVDFMCQNLI